MIYKTFNAFVFFLLANLSGLALANDGQGGLDNQIGGTVSSAKPKAVPVEKSDSSGNDCGGKDRCGQMSSCAEARHYLNDCGVTKLDRDHDGIPCESICWN
jgi:hypothetical protein